MGLERLERMADALLTLLERVRHAYDELYDTSQDEGPIDQGFAKGIYHARLEGIRDGILSGTEQEPELPW